MTDRELTRRSMLLAAGGAAAAMLNSGEAEARPAPVRGQSPYFYRFPIGQFEATVVSDGPLRLGEPSANFNGAGRDELAELLTENFLSPDTIVLEQNVLVLNTGSRLALFDSGMGASRALGTTSGRLIRSLAEAGISPRAIDAVIISHGHIDHVGGLVDARGRRLFPNAQVYIARSEYDFWTDAGLLRNDTLKTFITHARRNLLPYRNRMVFFEDGREVIPGVQAMATPGHTVGHTAFMISSGGQTVCSIGDLGHHHVLSIERPRMEFAYDSEPKRAVASRLRLLDTLAGQRIPMIAYHFPWPGIGHVSKRRDSFRYHPTPMQIVRVAPPPRRA